MDESLTFADGTVMNNSHAIESDRVLYVYVRDPEYGTIADVFGVLNDPEKVSEITCVQYGNETVYTDYSRLYCLRDEGGGLITAGLRKD